MGRVMEPRKERGAHVAPLVVQRVLTRLPAVPTAAAFSGADEEADDPEDHSSHQHVPEEVEYGTPDSQEEEDQK